jgi:hypothetical protein
VSRVEEIRDLSDGVGICALFVLYFWGEVGLEDICVPEPGTALSIYDTTRNQSLIARLSQELLPHPVHHLSLTDFLYVHGHMKQNVLAFIIDLFTHLELRPTSSVNLLTRDADYNINGF